MNLRKTLFYGGVLASVFLMVSCEGNSEEGVIEKEQEKTVSKELLDPNRSFNTTFDEELFSVPSPIQTALLIKSLSMPYNETLLNSEENAKEYTSTALQAVNLGVYGADLGYVTLYNQNSKSLSYLSIVENIANELGISRAFDKTFIKRFEENNTDQDSMLVILSDAFRKTDNFLKNNDRKNVSALILTGGWIESLYFATNLYKESNDQQLLVRIGEQSQSLETIIELLEKYNGEGQNDQFITSFKELKELFDKIKTSYEYIEPETNEETKITTIKSNTNIEISDDLSSKIIEKVAAVRNGIVNVTNQ